MRAAALPTGPPLSSVERSVTSTTVVDAEAWQRSFQVSSSGISAQPPPTAVQVV
ncbi:MAG TPA: hypothetical protein VGH63_13810 [Polyangia bacterium]